MHGCCCTLADAERVYRGNAGYADDPTRTYCYDNHVPNSRRITKGDFVVIRNKKSVLGTAFVKDIGQTQGTKQQHRCPYCGRAQIKVRKTLKPAYWCGCRATFDVPVTEDVPCTLFEASFGDTFSPATTHVSIEQLWDISLNLNRQFAILELDVAKVAAIFVADVARSHHVEDFALGARGEYLEGALRRVYVNRYERDPRAKAECIAYYGAVCYICGMDFASVYGDIAAGVVHVHHLIPLSEIPGEYQVDPIRDLRPVCPNCHVVAHLRVPPHRAEEVREMIRAAGNTCNVAQGRATEP